MIKIIWYKNRIWFGNFITTFRCYSILVISKLKTEFEKITRMHFNLEYNARKGTRQLDT